MPKRSSIGKRRSRALPALGFASLSLSMASGACASTSEAPANTSPPSQKYEIFLGEEEISDVSLATFYVFDKENAGPPPLFQKLRLAVGGGAGCGCGFVCAYWPQPPQPPKATQPTQHRSGPIGNSTAAFQAIVAQCCSRTSDYTIVQRYTRERISYWLCGPAALELRRSQDGRNAVCLRRAER